MAKKKDKPARSAGEGYQPVADGFSAISKRGWKVIGTGIGIVALGFFVLSLTDPQGQNWASKLSPFLILGGYAMIGFGIVTKTEVSRPMENESGKILQK